MSGASNFHGRALSIRKLNNIVYSRLNNPRSNVISDKWKFDTMQDWEFHAKNFDQVSNEQIAEADLLRLDVHLSAPGYLEEGRPCFNEVTEEYKEESNRDDVKEEPTDLK